jgi:hypothetical protein
MITCSFTAAPFDRRHGLSSLTALVIVCFQPVVGILLCKSRNPVVVEYALRDTTKPVGVAEYRVGRQLPADVRAAFQAVSSFKRN